MKASTKRERSIRRLLYGAILTVICLYLGQGAIIHLRLTFIDAEKPVLSLISESCDDSNCSAEFSFVSAHRFLLLGHVMRTHAILDENGTQIFPVSRVRGITADSWNGLRVYSVIPEKTYRIIATKPKAVKMGYFVGVLPRTTDHEGVLSVPDISPTTSTLTSLLGFGILGVLLFAASIAPSSGLDATKKRERLLTISISAMAAVLATTIGSGAIDSLMPDGELRSRILRTSLLLSIILLPLKQVLAGTRISDSTATLTSVISVALLVNLNWSLFRAGVGYVGIYTFVIGSLIYWLYRSQYRIQALLTSVCLFDSVKMLGLISIADLPPIYVLQPILVASFSLVVADLGAVAVISMAAKAYQRFTRDIAMNQITLILSAAHSTAENDMSNAVRNTLPRIAQITGAGRVSILVNLPFARPITHSYRVEDQSFVTHDDGKIPGAVTVRAFVYGDEAWFERYRDFSQRLSIPQATHLSKADYVCIAPIRVNQTNMGVLMLTSFDDAHIERLVNSGGIDDERETGRLIVDTIAAKFSEVVIQTMKTSTSLSSDLLARIREAIPIAASTQEFLDKFCDAIYRVTGMRTMLHERIEDGGVATAQAGFSLEEWRIFERSPFNLKASAKVAFGSTVVAFREKKASYIKNWTEVRDKLHPKTIEILDRIDVCSFLAVPLFVGNSQFVVTMVSRGGEPPRDPGLMRIIEATEAIFDAAVTVFNQRTSVLALGKLANRLIGDDDVRAQIIEAAKQEHLKTTIGTARTSFLLLFDLAGSTSLPADTEEKARSYGIFYDEVNKACQKHLGGKVRKTIGDAVIVTWDGTKTRLEDNSDLLGGLERVVAHADTIARQVGCKGVRAVLHHGDYFFGLIGTASFGQIDVIGRGIDEVCKIEGSMKMRVVNDKNIKIAISVAACNRLPLLEASHFIDARYHDVETIRQDGVPKESDIGWACVELMTDTSNGEAVEELNESEKSAS